jgi:hypothetical protein
MEAQRLRAESEEERHQRELERARRESGRKAEPVHPGTQRRAVPRVDSCTVVFVNQSGGPCKVTVSGRDAKVEASFEADLSAADEGARAVRPRRLPFTIEKVTVERDGRKADRALSMPLRAGATYEVRVEPDGAAEVVESKGAPR